ncbi:MAG: fused MFS/spermidine synthase [Candidatus Eremiobacteraeota bacterium]|nr:fused MFS/spermidine synthase [Candidatus Eremiobacteraeota bacterium]MBV8223193.1 fused MFS/spermidine synthase [Candidatus Eremiobacteraeota bacterium]
MPKTENFQWYVEAVAPGEVHGHAITATLASGESEFQRYAIVASPLFGKMLVLDGDTQSAALDEYVYHEALVHPACALVDEPSRALILGGGEGASLRELLRVKSMREVTMVDIDGIVVDACRKHLPEWSAGAFEDPRSELIIGDAKAYVEESREQFDVIIGDLTEPLEDSPSYGLHTVSMYQAIRARLRSGGVYALQTSMAGPHNFALHARMIATLRAAFERVAPYVAYVPAFDTVWGFALCGSQVDARSEEGAARAAAHAARLAGLRFYDGESHRGMFNLPRYLRDAYAAAAPLG